jgi:CubicO group peptidase (beta-lactamase class C family)
MWTAVETSYADAPIAGYGIGWTVDALDGRRRVWHSGGGKATFMHYPDDGLTVIVLTNRVGHDVNALATTISKEYLAS